VRGFGVILIAVGTYKYVIGIRPEETLLNSGYGKPELRQLVGFIVSLRWILEFAYFEEEFGSRGCIRCGVRRSRFFGAHGRLGCRLGSRWTGRLLLRSCVEFSRNQVGRGRDGGRWRGRRDGRCRRLQRSRRSGSRGSGFGSGIANAAGRSRGRSW